MLMKVLKWIGIGLAGVIVALLVAGGALLLRSQSRFNQTYNVPVEAIAISDDAASLAHGKHMAGMLCAGCHGENLAGTEFFNEPGLGVIHAANLTKGAGGIGATYSDADYVRTLRHGVRPNGTSIFVMPSKDFHHLSDQDLGSLIAYIKTAQPVDQAWGPKQFTLLGNVLVGLSVFDNMMMADLIDHTAPRPASPAIGVSQEYGGYLVQLNGCRQCHGAQLSGGKVDDPTIDMLGPNLTPAGELASWTDADFIKAIRTGTTPSGHLLSEVMPWKHYGAHMSDDELKATFLYLQSLPKLQTTTQ
jgi:mono/diheme cytochrome c family protein